MWRSWGRNAFWRLATLLVLAGCNLAEPSLSPATLDPIPTQELADVDVEGNPAQRWVVLAPGLEQRNYLPGSNRLSEIVALRFDPQFYTFRVHYSPGEAQTLNRWIGTLPDPVAFVNGNFYDQDDHIVGLLVTDGTSYGQAYEGFGGLFAIQGDHVAVRSSSLESYRGEHLDQAVQGFPMLLQNGVAAYGNDSTDRVARRTVVGQDVRGRIILMATPLVGMELVELSNFLASSDAELVNAFNLDGGGSTLMYNALGQGGPFALRSFDPVPAVLAVYRR